MCHIHVEWVDYILEKNYLLLFGELEQITTDVLFWRFPGCYVIDVFEGKRLIIVH